MDVQLASGILSNPVFCSRVMNGPYEIQQTIKDCTRVIGDIAVSMDFEITEDG